MTPYARAYARGEPGWRRMLEWVWYASGGRLKHLALMRASAASRRFVRLSTVLLAVGLAVFQVSRVGWRRVTASPEIEPTGSTTPAGDGWYLVAESPRPLPPGQAPEVPVDLWWNPVQTIVAFVTAWLGAVLLIWLMLILVRAGVRWAHTPPYRIEQRMTAAVHYSFAWSAPVFLGAVVAGLRPLSYTGAIECWAWYPSQRGFLLSAAVFAGFGVIMWWFWLVRLGSTAPTKTYVRVVVFWALGAPVIVAALSTGWWWGLDLLYEPLFGVLHVQF